MVSTRLLYWFPFVCLVSDVCGRTRNHLITKKAATTAAASVIRGKSAVLLLSNNSGRAPLHVCCERLRGGSTQMETLPLQSSVEVRQYQVQQQLLLQSRSVLLRQALIDRGLNALAFVSTEEKIAQPVDWECATSTPEHPKSCLYSFDAEHGSKVVAPRDTTQWITLAALNRLRRTDPTKVEPLWHDKYSILKTWFAPSPYSLYTYLSPRAALVSLVLDGAPWVTGLALVGLSLLVVLVTFPIWEWLMTHFLTSSLLWMQWPQWGRFVHAAFPLKLLLAQMAWKFAAGGFGQFYGRVRNHLIELECELWEQCIPRTILEDAQENEEDEEDIGEDAEENEDVDLR